MHRTYKFRLYPNTNQSRELGAMLETHRRLYNECMEQRIMMYKVARLSVDFNAQREWFQREKVFNPWYGRLNAHSAAKTIERLDRTFKAFFRRLKAGVKPGFPRFKSRDRFCSIPFCSYPSGLKLDGDNIRIQYIGNVRVKLHREIQGKIKTAAIKREVDKWYVFFVCDLGEITVEPSKNPSVGIDVGIESFLTTSDSEHEPNPEYLKTALPELRRKGRALARKKRGGKNRRKARKQVAGLHIRVKNLRKEHHHQTALKLVRRYGTVAVERLNIRGMLRNDRLSRAISDAAWGGFVGTLRCKAESAGVAVVEVDPRGTSQECSGCGAEVKKDLKVRRHDCPACGLSLQRDVNAARNILARAGLPRIGAAGRNVGHQAKRAPRSPSLSASPTRVTQLVMWTTDA
jgi:putative transposase